MSDHFKGSGSELKIFRVGERLRRSDYDGVACVNALTKSVRQRKEKERMIIQKEGKKEIVSNTERVEVLHVANCNAVVLTVSHNFVFNFLPTTKREIKFFSQQKTEEKFSTLIFEKKERKRYRRSSSIIIWCDEAKAFFAKSSNSSRLFANPDPKPPSNPKFKQFMMRKELGERKKLKKTCPSAFAYQENRLHEPKQDTRSFLRQ